MCRRRRFEKPASRFFLTGNFARNFIKASSKHFYAIYNASIDNVLQTNHHTRLVHTLVDHRMRIGMPIRPSCVIFNVSSHTHKISNIFTLKMTKNRSRCFPTTFRIHSDRQYFILVHTRSDMAPMGRHWTPYLYLRGNHHEKQNIRKVANRKLQPPSSPKHCSFTQYQHVRYRLYISPIDS